MAESKKTAPKLAKPLNDVTPADETAAEPTSKPIIVTNRPIMKDPTVVDHQAAGHEGMAETIPVNVRSKPELKLAKDEEAPSAGPEAKPDEKVEEKQSATDEKAEPDKNDATPPPEVKPTPPEDKPADEAEPEAAPEKQDGGTPDAAAIDEAEAAKKAEHEATIQKLADSKQYYLPVNAVEKRKSKQFVVLGVLLSLLLAAAWVDVALDAGIIQISGIKPVTHFFSN